MFASGSLTGPARVCTTRFAMVVVDVDDAGFRRDGLGHLVDVAAGRHARADVQELAQARLAGQVARGAGEERTVGPGGRDDVRMDPLRLLGGLPVGGEVVLAARMLP